MNKMDKMVLRGAIENQTSDAFPSATLPCVAGETSTGSEFDFFMASFHDHDYNALASPRSNDQPSPYSFSDTYTSHIDSASYSPSSAIFIVSNPHSSYPSNGSIQSSASNRHTSHSSTVFRRHVTPESEGTRLCPPCAAVVDNCEPEPVNHHQEQHNHASNPCVDYRRLDTLPCSNGSAIMRTNNQLSATSESMQSMPVAAENMSFTAHTDNKSGIPVKIGARFSREAVQVLKRWVFLNRRHPYPTEQEKAMLQLETGLDKTQITNWLTNARRKKAQEQRPRRASKLSGTASLDMPRRPGTPAIESSMSTTDPLKRWVDSPPENEPASVIAIARAVAAEREASSSRAGRYNCITTAEGPSHFSYDPSSASSAGTPSDGSRASGLSQASEGSWNTDSVRSQMRHHRRRRRRAVPRREESVSLISSSKPYQCTFCTETFKTKHDWQRHEKSLHLSLEKWTCALNGTRSVHPQSNQICCAFCGSVDPTDVHIESHNHSACKAKPMEYKSFYRKDHLNQHLKLVHGVQFCDWSMKSWKTNNVEIRSRCGFCGIIMASWPVRVEHLAEHFKCGSTIADWKGDWGFEAPVLNMLENAIPPYLIEMERISPFPFIASCAPTESPRTAYELITLELSYYMVNYGEEMGDLPKDDDLQLEACRIIYASEALSSQGISAKSSWLRDLLMASKDLARQAQFAALRRDVENKLCVLRINGKDNMFEECPLELELHEFVRAKASMSKPITDQELQKEACDIVSRTEIVPTSASDRVTGWIIRLIKSSANWLVDFRRRANIPRSDCIEGFQDLDSPITTMQEAQPRYSRDLIVNHPASTPRSFEAMMKKTFFLNDANCYRRLAQELTRFVLSNMSPNNPNRHIPTDAEIQHQARWILFDCDDPWNQTAADNDEWLQRFKRDVGIVDLQLDIEL